jgi:hypothetical protein
MRKVLKLKLFYVASEVGTNKDRVFIFKKSFRLVQYLSLRPIANSQRNLGVNQLTFYKLDCFPVGNFFYYYKKATTKLLHILFIWIGSRSLFK